MMIGKKSLGSLLLAGVMSAAMVFSMAPMPAYASEEPTPEVGSAVAIDEAHFPDAVFRAYIKTLDVNEDNILSEGEAKEVTVLTKNAAQGAKDLAGIEYLTALIKVNIPTGTVTCDVSKNANLEDFLAKETENLVSVKFGSLQKLVKINFADAPNLKSLDVSGVTNLTELVATDAGLESIKLGSLSQLQQADLHNNKNLKALDLSGVSSLQGLSLSGCSIKSLDLTNLQALKMLDVSGCKLSTLDLSAQTGMLLLNCNDNNLACVQADIDDSFSAGGITPFSVANNSHPIVLQPDGTFNLKTLPGFDVKKMSALNGATLNGTTLKVTGKAVSYMYDCGYGSPVEFKLNVVAQLPPAPKTVSANLSAYNAVTAKWSKVSGATGYEVYFKKSGDKVWSFAGKTKNTSFTKSKLTAGAKYSVKVVSYNAAGDGAGKTAASVYTLKKLSAPTVKKASSSKVRVRWTNINGESGYQISKSTKKTGTSIVATVKTTSGTSKVVSAKKGTTYYYKVRAYKTVNGKKIYAPWSNAKAFKLK